MDVIADCSKKTNKAVVSVTVQRHRAVTKTREKESGDSQEKVFSPGSTLARL